MSTATATNGSDRAARIRTLARTVRSRWRVVRYWRSRRRRGVRRLPPITLVDDDGREFEVTPVVVPDVPPEEPEHWYAGPARLGEDGEWDWMLIESPEDIWEDRESYPGYQPPGETWLN